MPRGRTPNSVSATTRWKASGLYHIEQSVPTVREGRRGATAAPLVPEPLRTHGQRVRRVELDRRETVLHFGHMVITGFTGTFLVERVRDEGLAGTGRDEPHIGGVSGSGRARRWRSCSCREPMIVKACAGRRVADSLCASTSWTASPIVLATDTHPQVQDTAHGAAMILLYASPERRSSSHTAKHRM